MDEGTRDWNKIDFPRRIGQKEARTLCRHLAFNLEGNCYVSLNTSRSEHFGDRFIDKTPAAPEEVLLISDGVSLEGGVHRTDNLAFIEFNFDKIYDRRGRISYEGMRLAVGAFDWDDLDVSNRTLVRDIRSSVQGYFEGKK